MLFSTIGQIYVFLWMMTAGLIIGAWYALMAALRKLLQAGFWLGLALDIAFGAGAAVVFSVFLVAANYGEVRLFAVFGAIIGCALFAIGLWPPVRALFAYVRGKLYRIYNAFKQNRLIKVIFR